MVRTKFKFKKIALGGTFDILHRGHKKTLSQAFSLGEKVLIGLSTDQLAKSLKKYRVNSYNYRKIALEEFLDKQHFLNRAKIIPIADRFGVAHVDKDLDAIMVSRGVMPIVRKINQARESKGLKKLQIILIKKVKAENGKPISSRRIRSGKIDEEGRLKIKQI